MHDTEILSETTVFQGFLSVIEAQVRFQQSDGSMSPAITRLSIERGDSVAVLLLTPQGDLVLTQQFRYPVLKKGPDKGWLVELPAGSLDHAGEDPAEAMRREIEEETGHKCGPLTLLFTFYPTPGGSSERIHLYSALSEGRTGEGGGVPEEHEDIETFEVPLEDAITKVLTGEIQDAKTIIAIFYLALRRGMSIL